MELKEKLLSQCKDFLSRRKKVIDGVILEIENSLLSETKSSAGDKHETGRAMLQLEREKAGVQLREIHKEEEIIAKIKTDKISNTIGLGSIVFTSQENYFISISAGEINKNEQSFYAISTSTPIGQLLMGKTIGDVVHFRAMSFKVLEVL
jgi:transcription elongation GreA/GreB family factor